MKLVRSRQLRKNPFARRYRSISEDAVKPWEYIEGLPNSMHELHASLLVQHARTLSHRNAVFKENFYKALRRFYRVYQHFPTDPQTMLPIAYENAKKQIVLTRAVKKKKN